MTSKSSTTTDLSEQDNAVFTAPSEGFRLFHRPHPGAILSERLSEAGLTAHALALKLRVPANRISAIANGTRSITADTALRLARYFGTTPQFWMNLQVSHDLWIAERDLGSKIEAEVEKAA